MSALAVLAVALGVLAAGEGAALVIQARRADRAATAAEQVCADRVAEVQDQVATCAGDLGECRAQVTANSLGAALAPELGEVQARADLIRDLPRAEVTRALIAVASPQLLAAESARLGCEAVSATGDSGRLGCGPQGAVITAWARAVEGLAACPEPSEGQAPE